MGPKPTTYNNGKIYTVPLVDSNSGSVLVKAFSVDSILVEKVSREEIMLNKEDFPHISKKYLDVLIGNPNLALHPVCETGFGCQDCTRGWCLYQSKFGSGYVPLGSFGKDQSVVTITKHVALTKVSSSPRTFQGGSCQKSQPHC